MPKLLTRSEREALRRDLYRELGFDKLTREDCMRELFGDLLGPNAPSPPNSARVVQDGPARRDTKKT